MFPPFSFSRLAVAFLALGLLVGCASQKPEEPSEKTAEALYNDGLNLMEKRLFREAATQFEEIERQHPYSQWAPRGQLMSAYAMYEALDYDAAIKALESFIRLHPGSEYIAYAYYLRALSDYERIADVRRDQTYAHLALSELQTIIRRFPDTAYARDARLKIDLVNDHLAGAEMEVGRNYMTQKLFTAAVGRFRTVVERYQSTSHVPEALHRLVESYLALGILDEAKKTAAVLGHNFPGSRWYQDSYDLLRKNGLID
ncbi:MAG: outer membrane protein assembly factor BamD [Alphaproteobacteria bacterium]|nr:outer membrane protein assembly factor BamD [Alphaproteobacteria bacterium]